MKLNELFISLALGELANSSYVELNQLELNKNQLTRVINAINQGLTLIHTHLPLRHNQIVIQLHDNIGTYYLDSRYAKSIQTVPLRLSLFWIHQVIHSKMIFSILLGYIT